MVCVEWAVTDGDGEVDIPENMLLVQMFAYQMEDERESLRDSNLALELIERWCHDAFGNEVMHHGRPKQGSHPIFRVMVSIRNARGCHGNFVGLPEVDYQRMDMSCVFHSTVQDGMSFYEYARRVADIMKRQYERERQIRKKRILDGVRMPS